MSVRVATSTDADAIARICLLTGDTGKDATGKYGDDTVLADVYATPYLYTPSGFALVWEEGGETLGYILGATDTRAFQTWFNEEWWPGTVSHHQSRTAHDDALLDEALVQDRTIIDRLDEFPAHLHIDLLPQAQGHGSGRLLVTAMLELLAERDVPGVHLTAEKANLGAQAFYPRVGFEPIAETGGAVTFAQRTPPSALRP